MIHFISFNKQSELHSLGEEDQIVFLICLLPHHWTEFFLCHHYSLRSPLPLPLPQQQGPQFNCLHCVPSIPEYHDCFSVE